MKRGPWRKHAGWLGSAAAALAICAAVVQYEKGYGEFGTVRLICDGFFVAGVILAGVGALVWIANAGGFTALGYGWYLLVRKLSFSRTAFEERLSYLEYVQQKSEKRRNPKCILAAGIICIAAAGVLLFFCQ